LVGEPFVQRDPLESAWVSTAFFGGVLFLAAVVKFVQAFVLAFSVEPNRQDDSDVLQAGIFLLVFAVGTGCTVAGARRFALRARSPRTKNLVTGGIAAGFYAGGCYVLFERGSPQGPDWLVLGFTFAGIWFAVASGLNEVFD
jgi:hypothetical protein